MKNTILDFDYEELDEFIVSDYFSKNIQLSEWIAENNYESFLDTYEIEDNDKIERISYELYKTSDYWDILIMINNNDPLFGMPYHFDVLSDESTNFVDRYRFEIYSHAPLLSEPRSSELHADFLEEQILENEIKRIIRIIKPEKMGEFIRLLKDEGLI